jgi:FG-GAP-like repeat
MGQNDSAALPTSMTLNGTALTLGFVNETGGTIDTPVYGYLVAPPAGTSTFAVNWSGVHTANYVVFTVQDALQTNPLDATNANWTLSGTSVAVSATTSVGNDLLLSFPWISHSSSLTSFGTGETSFVTEYNDNNFSAKVEGTWKVAAVSPGTESMSVSMSPANPINEPMIEMKSAIPSTGGVGTTTSYYPRVDDGSFNPYTFSNNTWIVYDKAGTKYTYGSDGTGRMYDTSAGTSTKTYRCMLQEVRDTNDNYIKYKYLRDNNTLYPYTITYTGHRSTDGISTVTFATSTRPDVLMTNAPDFTATTTQRITKIDASVNNSTVREYLLGYGTGENRSRSLLTSIQREGYDDNNNLTSLPATTFSYATSSFQFYAPATQTLKNASYALGDTDGDGIPDIALFMPGAGNGYLWSDNAPTAISVPNTSTPPPEYWARTPYPASPPEERGVRYIDVNGDGKADVVRGWVDDMHGTNDYGIYYNQYATSTGAYGWTASSTNYAGTIPTFAKETSGGLYITGGIFGDVNGDGLPDYVTAIPGTISTTTYLGNGSAWDATTTAFMAAKPFPSTVQTETASQLIDINGDGLDDWVYSSGNNIYVLLNNGAGWNSVPDPRWTFGTSTLFASTSTPNTYFDRGIRFCDINGDGLPDLIRSYKVAAGDGCSGAEVADVKAVYLNTGSGWATSTAYALPAYITTCSSGAITTNEYANFNGNGQLKQDVLSSVTNPNGGGVSVVYALTGNAGAGTRVLSVSTTTISDGRGNYAATSYAYAGGAWYTNSGVRDRRSAGYSSVTVTAPDSIVTTYYDKELLPSSVVQYARTLRTSRERLRNAHYSVGTPWRTET